MADIKTLEGLTDEKPATFVTAAKSVGSESRTFVTAP